MLMTLGELVEHLPVDPDGIYELLRNHHLPFDRVDGQIRFDKHESQTLSHIAGGNTATAYLKPRWPLELEFATHRLAMMISAALLLFLARVRATCDHGCTQGNACSGANRQNLAKPIQA
jgi:hypothetical protein